MGKETKEVEAAIQEQEQVYTRLELLAAAASFGVQQEVVAGALRLSGRDGMTRLEAEKAIKNFLEREV